MEVCNESVFQMKVRNGRHLEFKVHNGNYGAGEATLVHELSEIALLE